MSMKKSSCLLFFCLLNTTYLALAQDSLWLHQAIEVALQNNYSINISRIQSNIAENSNTLGNAGFLPSLTLNTAASSSNNNVRQEFITGNIVNQTGARSTALMTGVALNWTIFDGLKMFAVKERLSELEEQGKLNLKAEIENTIVVISRAYYDIVRQQQLIKATHEAIEIYEESLKLAELKYAIGSASKVDVLHYRVDLNTHRTLLLKQNLALHEYKVLLNGLLSKKADYDYFVDENIVIDYKPVYADLQKTALKSNTQVLAGKNKIKISGSSINELRGERLPQIGFTSFYNFTENTNQAGFQLFNRSLSFNTGITASWTLFSGFQLNNQIQNLKLTVEQNRLELSRTNLFVESSLSKLFKAYLTALEILKLEEENLLYAREYIVIAMERFRIGNSNSIELMTAQKSYEEAQVRLIEARYNAKNAEVELKRLEGELVK